MSLNLKAFQDSIISLDRAIEQPLTEFTRDSVIQRFEYTYELAWKMLRRILKDEIGLIDIESKSRRDLFRIASQHSLIGDPSEWFAFNDARNLTSHTYNIATAEEVYSVAIRFAPAVKTLLKELEKFCE